MYGPFRIRIAGMCFDHDDRMIIFFYKLMRSDPNDAKEQDQKRTTRNNRKF